jgi:hypothetical protein
MKRTGKSDDAGMRLMLRQFNRLTTSLQTGFDVKNLPTVNDVHIFGMTKVCGRPVSVFVTTNGYRLETKDGNLSACFTVDGHQHVLITESAATDFPSKGNPLVDYSPALAHELYHAVHWNTNNYKDLDCETAALLVEQVIYAMEELEFFFFE